nr:hypothetical protein [Tanacetum cinerariifolium]
MMVQAQEEMGEGTEVPYPQHTPIIIQPSKSQPQRKQRHRKSKRQYTVLPQTSVPTEFVSDEAVNEEMNNSFERATTIATSLDARQGRQDTMGDAVAKTSLKRRVKKLKKKQRSRSHKLKRLYKVGLSARVESYDDEGLGEEDASKQERIIDDLDADEDITLINDKEMFDADKELQGEEVVVEQEVVADKELIVDDARVSTAATTITIDDITLAKALEAIKTLKPKIKGIVIKDHEEPSKSRTKTSISSKKSQDNEKVDANYQLAERMQANQQQELNKEEKAKLFIELLEKRRKFFAAKRTKEKRNRPPTKSQQRSLMCTYLKNMDGWKPKALKNKSFANIQELFDKPMKRIHTFVDFRTELVEESSKKVEAEITQKEKDMQRREEEKLVKAKYGSTRPEEDMTECYGVI